MTERRRVAVLVGSLRRDSLNRKLATALMRLAPPQLEMTIVEIGALPLYDPDHEAEPSAPVREFKQSIAAAGAALFVTPEYNRSVPGALKNAIDHASRPYGESVWAGKPAAVITLSPGAIGGFGANHHLRQMLVFLDMPTMAQPEAYVGNGARLFGADGSVTVPETRDFLSKFVAAFANWVERTALSRRDA